MQAVTGDNAGQAEVCGGVLRRGSGQRVARRGQRGRRRNSGLGPPGHEARWHGFSPRSTQPAPAGFMTPPCFTRRDFSRRPCVAGRAGNVD